MCLIRHDHVQGEERSQMGPTRGQEAGREPFPGRINLGPREGKIEMMPDEGGERKYLNCLKIAK